MTMQRKLSLTAMALGTMLLLGGCGTQLEGARAAFGYSGLTAGDPTLSTYEQAKADFVAARYGLAAKRFNIAMTEDPSSIEAVNGLAATYDQIGRFDLAERYYRRALAMDPDSVQTLNNLGYSLLLQGKQDLAVAFLRDAIRRAPENTVVIANAELAVAALITARAPEPAGAPAPEPATMPAKQPEPALRITRVNAGVQTLHLTGLSGGPQIEAQPLMPVDSQPLPPLPGQTDASVTPTPDSALPNAQIAAATAARPPAVYLIKAATESETLVPAGPSEALAEAASLTGSIEVANGTGRRHMAARMSSYLSGFGLAVARLANAEHFSHKSTTITYRHGFRNLAEALSASLPIAPLLRRVPEQTVDVRVELGGDLLDFDRGLLQAERNTSHAATL